MKILMLAPQPFFEPRGTPLSILGRLRALSELGHHVDLVTYHLGEEISIPNVVIHRTPQIRGIKGIRVGPSVVKCFLDVLLLAKAFSLLQRHCYDLLHTHEEAGYFGVLLSKLFGTRHLYDMHSSLPQQLSNFQYSRSRLLIRLFERLERWVIKCSHAIITICPALAEYVVAIDPQARFEMIENVPSETDAGPVSEEEVERLRNAYCVDGKKVVFYAGTLEPYQGIDLMISGAARILRQRTDVLFLLAGGTRRQVHDYQEQIKKLGLSPYFRLLGTRPAKEMPVALQLSHVLMSPRVNGTNTPLKIYSYLQSGKPIVATNIRTHTQVLDANAALLVNPEPEAFARGILSVLDDPALAVRLGEGARQLAEARYGYKLILQKTEQVLQMAMR
jgi:glycosyltransferase involved in cell wall biosynthesis